jgi:hypothetical protein
VSDDDKALRNLGVILVILAAFLAIIVIYITWVGRFE